VDSSSAFPKAKTDRPAKPKIVCRVLAGIPARYSSSRLDGKPLVEIGSKTLIQHAYERCSQATTVDEVLVATDDERIARRVREFGGTAIMTTGDHRTGTDRLAEVASDVECEIVVNTQCDTPLFPPEAIDLAVRVLLDNPEIKMSTVAAPSTDREEIESPNSVKVVTDLNGDALYFTRALIPPEDDPKVDILLHIGIYVYRRGFLLELAAREQTPLELTEHLEQLRVLEHGDRIRVVRIPECPPNLHDQRDLELIRRLVARGEDG
jgi:3-deoxy-manno-octulosonate cytidylyltransferase (CMP-KDO synthetase)